MEMCYDGTLIMPSNYVVMDAEEMTYVDGGTATTFKDNMVGLWNNSADIRYALKASGLTYAMITAAASYSYTMAVATFGTPIIAAASVLSSPVGGAIAALSVGAAVAYLWNKRVFY